MLLVVVVHRVRPIGHVVSVQRHDSSQIKDIAKQTRIHTRVQIRNRMVIREQEKEARPHPTDVSTTITIRTVKQLTRALRLHETMIFIIIIVIIVVMLLLQWHNCNNDSNREIQYGNGHTLPILRVHGSIRHEYALPITDDYESVRLLRTDLAEMHSVVDGS